MSDPKSLRSTLLRDRNFRWLLSGGIVSGLGDQFTMIALPWLVLTMTGDPLALGLVIATMSVPRALFMLVGDAMLAAIALLAYLLTPMRTIRSA
jgi:hypothetical protein